MRINLIGNFQARTGLGQDAALLRGLILSEYPDADIRVFAHYLPECPEEEYNFFI